MHSGKLCSAALDARRLKLTDRLGSWAGAGWLGAEASRTISVRVSTRVE
jgi:hypothetical protein